MNLYILLGVIGPWQILLIVLVVLLLFGGRKIPDLMKGLGQGIREFKKAVKGEDSQKESKDNIAIENKKEDKKNMN